MNIKSDRILLQDIARKAMISGGLDLDFPDAEIGYLRQSGSHEKIQKGFQVDYVYGCTAKADKYKLSRLSKLLFSSGPGLLYDKDSVTLCLRALVAKKN